jgi:hypothetical protein
MVASAKKTLLAEHGDVGPDDFWFGMLAGYRRAVRLLYGNVDEMFREDPMAALLTIEGLAIEAIAKETMK